MKANMNNNECIQAIYARMAIHRAEGRVLFGSKDYKLFRSTNGGANWEEDGFISVPSCQRKIENYPLLKQIIRGEISGILPLPDGTRLCTARRVLLRAEPGSSIYLSVL
jgi:hypothetical protein